MDDLGKPCQGARYITPSLLEPYTRVKAEKIADTIRKAEGTSMLFGPKPTTMSMEEHLNNNAITASTPSVQGIGGLPVFKRVESGTFPAEPGGFLFIERELPDSVQQPPQTIEDILSEREKTHGIFLSHATITQRLKEVMRHGKNWDSLDYDQKEALDMCAHKFGRILSGDPNVIDHYLDSEGYLRLVSDRLEKERK